MSYFDTIIRDARGSRAGESPVPVLPESGVMPLAEPPAINGDELVMAKPSLSATPVQSSSETANQPIRSAPAAEGDDRQGLETSGTTESINSLSGPAPANIARAITTETDTGWRVNSTEMPSSVKPTIVAESPAAVAVAPATSKPRAGLSENSELAAEVWQAQPVVEQGGESAAAMVPPAVDTAASPSIRPHKAAVSVSAESADSSRSVEQEAAAMAVNAPPQPPLVAATPAAPLPSGAPTLRRPPRDAASSQEAVTVQTPQVHIGQIDIVVQTVKPARVTEQRSSAADFASRLYLRGL